MHPVINGEVVKTVIVDGKRRKLRCECQGKNLWHKHIEKYNLARENDGVGVRCSVVDMECDNCGYYPWVIL